jgi:ABC-type sugar transport system ATPase subunit
MATLQLKHLTKQFDDGATGVDAIDLDVADREFVVIVGPSGCGKSTTLRLIAGIEDETAGDIRIDGQPVNHLSPGARDVAMVFQSYALYPHMTVAQNIGFGLRRRGISRSKAALAVQEAAETLELTEFLHRRPATLSGGQRQRVAMGRAMVRRPKLFLFDEPLSNLDARLRVSMRSEIRRLQTLVPTTTIYVTHDQTEAMTLADRVVVMNKGRIEQVGPAMDIYRHPASLFVAQFIGSPTMNTLDATLTETGATLRDGTRIALPVSGQSGRDVVLGFRPEAITVNAGTTGTPARVATLEPVGQELIVEFDAGALGALWARLPPDSRLGRGDGVMLNLDPAQAHVFDRATGAALPRAPETRIDRAS